MENYVAKDAYDEMSEEVTGCSLDGSRESLAIAETDGDQDFSAQLVCTQQDVKILVPDYRFIHLDLIPMLLGFFTYKIATFTQAIEEGVNAATGKIQL
ncbi:hypothetical protein ACS0TY_013968 [Phlomoides rotata]